MKKLLVLFSVVVALCSMKQDNVITMYLVGDSTMALKDTTSGSPERGWGMMVQKLFDENKLVVCNRARNGRSSTSIIRNGEWKWVYEHVKPGDYVVIQFGHNDEKKGENRHAEPGSTFDANLKFFINQVREKGGKPFLMNCVVRRNFAKKEVDTKQGDDESLRNTTAGPAKTTKEEGDTLYDTHAYYRYSPREVALEMQVPFVDANKITHQLEQSLGREKSKKLHMIFAPGEHPAIPKGRTDNTHYNVWGADTVAQLLVKAMVFEEPALQQYLCQPSKKSKKKKK